MKTWISAALSLLLGASAAGATSFVMVSDGDLAAQAALVAEVAVVARGDAPASRPATDYLVEVERVWKGDVPGGRLVVRVPGGAGLKIWGAPAFAVGERALLFLEPERDGSYGILHLMLGAFHIAGPAAGARAWRDLSEAAEVTPEGSPVTGSPEPPRDLARFTAWIVAAALGHGRPADYWLTDDASGLRPGRAPFTELGGSDGVPIRWFVFDGGGRVRWKIDPAGQPGLGASASTAAFQAALAAWNADPTSQIDLELDGTTQATAGLTGSDGVNALLFNDPGNASVPSAYVCGKGGILAMSGPYYQGDVRLYDGRPYHEAYEADIVVNDGTECFFRNNPTGAEEVFAHELGHTLGLGHSADKEALMWAVAHNDGRGARLADDDRLAVNQVYGDGRWQPPPPQAPPSATGGGAAMTLRAASVERTEVDLAWTGGDAADADALLVEVKSGRKFRTLLTLPADASAAAVQRLARNTSYVFRLSVQRGRTVTPASNLLAVRTPR